MKRQQALVIHTVAFAFLLLTPALSLADEAAMQTAQQTPVAIQDVATGGYWSDEGDEGVFRAVVVSAGVEHVSQKLFIQWVQSNTQDQGQKLVRTLYVSELEENGASILEITTDFGDVNAFKINVLQRTRDQKENRFLITATGAGNYEIRSR